MGLRELGRVSPHPIPLDFFFNLVCVSESPFFGGSFSIRLFVAQAEGIAFAGRTISIFVSLSLFEEGCGLECWKTVLTEQRTVKCVN